VGLRVDAGFRARLAELLAALRAAASGLQLALGVLLLDDPEVMRAARRMGVAFYPWRKSTRPLG
jgi:hypothetical protein